MFTYTYIYVRRYGRSIGSGPTCEMASRTEVGGVVLQSAFTSCIRVAYDLRYTRMQQRLVYICMCIYMCVRLYVNVLSCSCVAERIMSCIRVAHDLRYTRTKMFVYMYVYLCACAFIRNSIHLFLCCRAHYVLYASCI